MQFNLEICVDSFASAIIAQEAGAQRIELCDSLVEGGTTPSAGKIGFIRKNTSIKLHVIIRPRGGDFLYSAAEYEIMRRDIELCGEIGADGIVLGILTREGYIDIDRCARLVGEARPMSVTFHRAFDMCNDPNRGLTDVMATGAGRLLTSGQMKDALSGVATIAELVRKAGTSLIVMPGGGLSVSNIREIAELTGASEFHMTGRKTTDSQMSFRRGGINMGSGNPEDEFRMKTADHDIIGNVVKILKMI